MSQELDNNVLHLIKQKEFCPYKYMRNLEKFNEEFRSKEKFYSLLTDRKIGDKEYEHVLNVWNKFEIKLMKDYHNLYLKCDVLLLVDVLKNRNNSFKNYGLCRSHYLSTPSISWDAMLKMTKIEPELIPNPDMHILFEKDTRDRISYISNRYS